MIDFPLTASVSNLTISPTDTTVLPAAPLIPVIVTLPSVPLTATPVYEFPPVVVDVVSVEPKYA